MAVPSRTTARIRAAHRPSAPSAPAISLLLAAGALSWVLSIVVARLAGLSGTFLAGMLMIVSSALVLHPAIRASRGAMLAFSVVVAAHHAVAIVNAYVRTVPGADLDAMSFHTHASYMAAGVVPPYNPEFYTRALAAIYRFAGSSHLLGEQLSVLGFAVSCVVMCRLAAAVGESKSTAGMLLTFGLLPSVLVFTSVTLREAFQMVFVALAAEAALRLRKGINWRAAAQLAVAAAALTVLHHGLAMFAAFVIVTALVAVYRRRSGGVLKTATKRIWAVAIAVALIAAWKPLAMTVGRAPLAVLSGKAFEAVANFRAGAATIVGRTSYGILVDPSSPFDLFRKLPLMLTYYMFAPFPWQVGSGADVIAFAEGTLRLALLIGAIHGWRKSRGESRSARGFLLLWYAVIESMWAIGTLNWGTAARHHVPAYPLLVVLGWPSVFGALRTLAAALIGQRRFARSARRDALNSPPAAVR